MKVVDLGIKFLHLSVFDLLLYIMGNIRPLSLQSIAIEVQSESKWKQLGELAMSTGKVFFYVI